MFQSGHIANELEKCRNDFKIFESRNPWKEEFRWHSRHLLNGNLVDDSLSAQNPCSRSSEMIRIIRFSYIRTVISKLLGNSMMTRASAHRTLGFSKNWKKHNGWCNSRMFCSMLALYSSVLLKRISKNLTDEIMISMPFRIFMRGSTNECSFNFYFSEMIWKCGSVWIQKCEYANRNNLFSYYVHPSNGNPDWQITARSALLPVLRPKESLIRIFAQTRIAIMSLLSANCFSDVSNLSSTFPQLEISSFPWRDDQ